MMTMVQSITVARNSNDDAVQPMLADDVAVICWCVRCDLL